MRIQSLTYLCHFCFFISGLLSINAHADSKLHPNGRLIKELPNPQINITRFSGQSDFYREESSNFKITEDGKFKRSGEVNTRILVDDSPPPLRCEQILNDLVENTPKVDNLFSAHQRFELNKLVDMGTLNPNQFKEILEGSGKLLPSQVNFVTRTRDISRSRAEEIWGPTLNDHIEHMSVMRYDADTIPLITATMASFSGQVLDPRTQYVHRTTLPWQMDPERAELAKNFDRKRFPLVWEWGRLAQDTPGEFEALASVLAASNYQELTALGGKIEDAFVVFHSMNVLNTKAYLRRFPKTLYPADHTDLSDALLVIPMSAIIKEFPPSRYSDRTHRVIEDSGGLVDETKAIKLVADLQRVLHTHLDQTLDGKRVAAPIDILDMSIAQGWRNVRVLQNLGFSGQEALPKIQEVIRKLQTAEPIWNVGQYQDLSDSTFSRFYYHPKNAVEISNLSSKLALTTPHYVPRVLTSVLEWYLATLMHKDGNQTDGAEALRALDHYDIKFGITTFDEELAQQIRSLHPVEEYTFTFPERDVVPDPRIYKGREWKDRGHATPPTAFLFTVRQIMELSDRYSGRYYLDKADENIWARQLMLSNQDIF